MRVRVCACVCVCNITAEKVLRRSPPRINLPIVDVSSIDLIIDININIRTYTYRYTIEPCEVLRTLSVTLLDFPECDITPAIDTFARITGGVSVKDR